MFVNGLTHSPILPRVFINQNVPVGQNHLRLILEAYEYGLIIFDNIFFCWPARYYGIIEVAITVFSVKHVGPHTKTHIVARNHRGGYYRFSCKARRSSSLYMLMRLES